MMNLIRPSCRWIAIAITLPLAACALLPPEGGDAPPAQEAVRVDETAMLPLLGYYQLLQKMSSQELTRERQTLVAVPQTPAAQVRLAMLLGLPRATIDLPRAQALLESVLRSGEPAAASLHPLAQALASNYQERQKLDLQNDRLAQKLKESQRRNEDLKEKIEALARIERTIPVRPNARQNLP